MGDSEMILRAIAAEVEWVEKGPNDPNEKTRVSLSRWETWDRGFKFAPDATAALIIDGVFYFDGDMSVYGSKEALSSRNPAYVIIRAVDKPPKRAVRRSYALIRKEFYPSDEGMDSIDYFIQED